MEILIQKECIDGLYTSSIQTAINRVSALGGGRVVIPDGVFMTGTLWLKSHVELHLEKGAILRASPELKNYNSDDAYEQNYTCPAEGWDGKHLIIAHECEDVAITGLGTIDGNGQAFMAEKGSGNSLIYPWRNGKAREKVSGIPRPGQLICFIECRNITLRDLTIVNATSWTVFLYGCDYASLSGLRIYNPDYWLNTDGVDIDTCRYVTLSDCIIRTGDDCITFRGAGKRLKDQNRACEFITVVNCVLSASACAFRIGVGTFSVRHVTVSNITVIKAGVVANFFPEWAGTSHTPLEYISFNNITANDTGRLIELNVFNGTPCRHIMIDTVMGKACSAVRMVSRSEGAVSDITLRHIDAVALRDINYFADDTPEAPDGRFFHCEGIDNLHIEDCRVSVSPELTERLVKTVDIEKNTCLCVRDCLWPKDDEMREPQLEQLGEAAIDKGELLMKSTASLDGD